MSRTIGWVGLALGVIGALGPGLALADEPVSKAAPRPAPMIMNLLSPVMPTQDEAFRDSLRAPDPSPSTGRAGRPAITITVSEPCPEGDLFHEMKANAPRPRPGRTRR